MTELEWLQGKGDAAQVMWQLLGPEPSRRKQRLFATELGKTILAPYLWEFLDVAERYANGELSENERLLARQRAPKSHTAGVLACWALADGNQLFDGTFQLLHICSGKIKGNASELIRDIFGNPFHPLPFDPAWRTPTVTALAEAIYDERRFEDMPILADALEEAGCADATVLEHCRGPGPHVRGCWLLDLLLGKG